LLIIPDPSTSLAAMRTGQVDILREVGYENSESLLETNPELQTLRKPQGNAWDIELDNRIPPFGPTDDPDALKVRQAASMAIDREAIIEDYYQGEAVQNTAQIAPAYMVAPPMDALKLENLPEENRILFEYDPERAKELLAEAGYPNGIKVILHVVPTEADYYALIKNYWDAVGIETEIDVIDVGVFWGMAFNQSWEGALGAHSGVGFTTSQHHRNPDGTPFGWNINGSTCARCDELFAVMSEAYDWESRAELMTEIELLGMATADKLYLPTPVVTNFWQPWIKGYSGEDHVGTGDIYGMATYIWIDESLK